MAIIVSKQLDISMVKRGVLQKFYSLKFYVIACLANANGYVALKYI